MILNDSNYSRLDKAFAQFIITRARINDSKTWLFQSIILRLSNELSHGHNCILVNPDEIDVLMSSGVVGSSGDLPLVIEDDRLYFHRYWHYETRLARQIRAMLNAEKLSPVLDDLLNRYYPPQTDIAVDWQGEAAKLAVQYRFCIISGGPGTGKTTTIIKILAILQELTLEKPLHIALAAPTGKAAMRLSAAINDKICDLPCSDEVKKLIPTEVFTLHRLLGARPPSPFFYHSAEQPLIYDLVVVDEASMVDLSLMSKLVDTLKSGARLLLLGDKNQLASVEAGAVLGDLSMALPKHTVELQVSYRFTLEIKKLADLVNQQYADEAWTMLQQESRACALLRQGLSTFVAEQLSDYFKLVAAGADYSQIYQAYSQFQVLCATRYGDFGVIALNQQIERKLRDRQCIVGTETWYPGRPVIILQNSPALKLYNGDIGICLPDSQQNDRLMVYFQRANGELQAYLPARLPMNESVFAMTIHKSQGSEFANVLIVLPEHDAPILSKELLYTAITRAKNSVKLSVTHAVFFSMVKRKCQRMTGLGEKLKDQSIGLY